MPPRTPKVVLLQGSWNLPCISGPLHLLVEGGNEAACIIPEGGLQGDIGCPIPPMILKSWLLSSEAPPPPPPGPKALLGTIVSQKASSVLIQLH